jgi:hypothetical protein
MPSEPEEENSLQFGPIEITWEARTRYPVAIDHERLLLKRRWRKACFITHCPVKFRYRGTEHAITVPPDFRFDAATIPQWLWWLPGFAPLGKHIWAALLHDWLCELAKRGQFDREVADAIFSAVLKHTKVDWRRAKACGVHLYRRLRNWIPICIVLAAAAPWPLAARAQWVPAQPPPQDCPDGFCSPLQQTPDGHWIAPLEPQPAWDDARIVKVRNGTRRGGSGRRLDLRAHLRACDGRTWRLGAGGVFRRPAMGHRQGDRDRPGGGRGLAAPAQGRGGEFFSAGRRGACRWVRTSRARAAGRSRTSAARSWA